jgi:hypothetical protein
MTTIRIELPDEQAAALSAKGLSIEGWLQKMAEAEASLQAPPSPEEAVARILVLENNVKPDPEGWTVKGLHQLRPSLNHGGFCR